MSIARHLLCFRYGFLKQFLRKTAEIDLSLYSGYRITDALWNEGVFLKVSSNIRKLWTFIWNIRMLFHETLVLALMFLWGLTAFQEIMAVSYPNYVPRCHTQYVILFIYPCLTSKWQPLLRGRNFLPKRMQPAKPWTHDLCVTIWAMKKLSTEVLVIQLQRKIQQALTGNSRLLFWVKPQLGTLSEHE